MRHTGMSKGRIKALFTIAAVILVSGTIFLVQITDITVTGTQRYTEEEISDILFQKRGSRNSLWCYLNDRFGQHAIIPFVEDYKIDFQSPVQIEVIIYEKSIVGYVSYMKSYMYFDKDGIIVESTSQKLEGIPEITGLEFGHIVLHEPLPVDSDKIFEEILNLTQILSLYEIQVDRIQFDSLGRASLFFGSIEVILGDNKDINGKIKELHDMMPQLEGLSGTLYLDKYDEKKSGQPFILKIKP